MQLATLFVKCRSWLVKMTVPSYSSKRLGQYLDGVDVQMIARFIENQHVGIAQEQPCQAEPGPLPSGQDGDRLLDMHTPEQHGTGNFENLLILLTLGSLPLEVTEHRFALREAGVNVLSIDADLATKAPADFPGQRLEGVDHRA